MVWTKAKEPLHVATWFERDRAHVSLQDANDRPILEFWDEAVQEAVDDGFIKPRDWAGSMIEYATHLGIMRKRPANLGGGYEFQRGRKSNPKGKRRAKKNAPRKRSFDVPEGHQIKIAKSTLRMSDVGALVMGGMDKPTARAILKKHGLYTREVKRIDEIRENPRRQRRANPARKKARRKK